MLFYHFWICIIRAIIILERRKIIVNIIAYNRPDSLISTLEYLSCNVKKEIELKFWIDGPKNKKDLLNVRSVYQIAKRYYWPEEGMGNGNGKGNRNGNRNGIKKSIYRSFTNIGIRNQWLRAWKLPKQNEYCLFLEDDVLIHRESLYILYKFVEGMEWKFDHDYYLNSCPLDQNENISIGNGNGSDNNDNEESILGITLQRPKWQLGINENNKWRRLDQIKNVGLIKFIGPATWGTLFFPSSWRKFLYQIERLEKLKIDGLIDWKKRKEFNGKEKDWKNVEGDNDNDENENDHSLISPLLMKFAIKNNLPTIYILLENDYYENEIIKDTSFNSKKIETNDNHRNNHEMKFNSIETKSQRALAISLMPNGVNFNGSTNKYHKEILAIMIKREMMKILNDIKCKNIINHIPYYNHCFDKIEFKGNSFKKIFWIKTHKQLEGLIYSQWNKRFFNFAIASNNDQVVAISKSYNIFSFKSDFNQPLMEMIIDQKDENDNNKHGNEINQHNDWQIKELKCPFVPGLYPEINI